MIANDIIRANNTVAGQSLFLLSGKQHGFISGGELAGLYRQTG
jgi:hypothetical protein